MESISHRNIIGPPQIFQFSQKTSVSAGRKHYANSNKKSHEWKFECFSSSCESIYMAPRPRPTSTTVRSFWSVKTILKNNLLKNVAERTTRMWFMCFSFIYFYGRREVAYAFRLVNSLPTKICRIFNVLYSVFRFNEWFSSSKFLCLCWMRCSAETLAERQNQ